jgi:hypothetical protein
MNILTTKKKGRLFNLMISWDSETYAIDDIYKYISYWIIHSKLLKIENKPSIINLMISCHDVVLCRSF